MMIGSGKYSNGGEDDTYKEEIARIGPFRES